MCRIANDLEEKEIIIEYSPETEDHFQYLSKRQQVMVLDTVEKQLQLQPKIAI